METHLDMKIREFIEGGMSEFEATRTARAQFGNPTLQQEDSRSMWIAQWFSDAMQDIAFALRTFRKQPGFASVAVLSAGLGIGACSTIFGLANYALFRPLPVHEPSRLLSVTGKSTKSAKVGISMSYPDFLDLRQAPAFEGLTAFYSFMPASIGGAGEPQRYWGSIVTANYFDVVRPTLVLGRGFDAERDDMKGQPPVIVLSHRLWRTRFNADEHILGRALDFNGRKATVAGVAGPAFRGTEAMFYSDFWVPLSMMDSLAQLGMGGDRLTNRDNQWLMAAGRLREGASLKAAASELDTLAKRLASAWPATNAHRAFHTERAGQVTPALRTVLFTSFFLLLGVAALVLITACANVANLLLARAAARQREIATRLAVGAGRGRLMRQLLTESTVLGLLGGLSGYVLARVGVALLAQAPIPLSLPVDLAITLDHRVMLFSAALSLVTGVVFGLVPAMRATRPDLASGLKDTRFGLRNALVISQVTLCTVLLICSGLFVRSLYAARNIDPGFKHRNVLLLAFDPSLNRYSPEQTHRLVESIVEGTRALPGVQSVSFASSVPLDMERTQNAFTAEGKPSDLIHADISSVAPGYFETLGVAFNAGDDFKAGKSDEDIVIVNRALAERAFPGENPLGRRISYMGRSIRITGLVATTKAASIGEEPRPALYFPMARELRGNDSLTGITLVVRTASDPATYMQTVRQTIRAVDPTLAVFNVRSMERQLSQALFLPRVAAFLFGLAGIMGLVIATIGIYGVISFSVARRTKEIGIRMALGARRDQVLRMVLGQGIALTVIGACLGLGLSLAGKRIVARLLYGIEATDGLTFLAVPLVLVAVAAAACFNPARRAASVDPIGSLRYD
jgi:predicted permease